MSHVTTVSVCQLCRYELCYIPPDCLVKGGTEDLIVVLGEAQTGHTFVVGVLKSAQAQAALDLPHLLREIMRLPHEKYH